MTKVEKIFKPFWTIYDYLATRNSPTDFDAYYKYFGDMVIRATLSILAFVAILLAAVFISLAPILLSAYLNSLTGLLLYPAYIFMIILVYSLHEWEEDRNDDH